MFWICSEDKVFFAHFFHTIDLQLDLEMCSSAIGRCIGLGVGRTSFRLSVVDGFAIRPTSQLLTRYRLHCLSLIDRFVNCQLVQEICHLYSIRQLDYYIDGKFAHTVCNLWLSRFLQYVAASALHINLALYLYSSGADGAF
jgi:hypothetical protein